MTTEEFALASANLATFANYNRTPDDPALRLLLKMVRQRVRGDGREQYEVDATTQSVEVKPLGDLLRDIREEGADVVPYAAAIHMRVEDDVVREQTMALAVIAYDLMAACDRIEDALAKAGVNA